MSAFDDFINSTPLGDAFYNSKKDKQKASDAVKGSQDAWNGVTPPKFQSVNYQGPAQDAGAVATQAGPSAANNINVNPEYNQAQSAQMAALSNIAARGGRSAASDANLARIQQGENANAKGQRDAILQSAAARGQGGSGASLLAQLSSSQNATNNQSARDMDVAGMESNAAIQAGQGAAAIGAGMQREDYGEQANRAAANDAIDRYNAGNATNVSVFNSGQRQGVNNATAAAGNASQEMNHYQMPQASFQDSATKAGGLSGALNHATDYYGGQADFGTKAKGNIWGSAAELAFAPTPPAAAWGGKTPGKAAVPGNSLLNDFVPIMSSPGEVQVSRALAQKGTPQEIGEFVKHAPTIKADPKQNKEAQLSALKNIARKRRAS